MTNEEALEQVIAAITKMEDEGRKYLSEYISKDTLITCMNALKKQVEKKPKEYYYAHPIYDNEGYEVDGVFMYKANCPCCNELIADGELEKSDLQYIKYCQSCGQKIDWSDGDGE